MQPARFAAALGLALSLALLTSPVLAQEPTGCDKFKWPIERERAMLRAPAQRVTSGAEIAALTDTAVAVSLQPTQQAALPQPPERKGKDGSFAGFVHLPAPVAGTYKVSVSSGAWIDAVQDGRYLKPAAFSGVTGCDGIRKSVKFAFDAFPVLLQFSGVATDSIAVVITRD